MYVFFAKYIYNEYIRPYSLITRCFYDFPSDLSVLMCQHCHGNPSPTKYM